MPTVTDLAVQTVGEQEWQILRLEEENRELRDEVQALRQAPRTKGVTHASALDSPSLHADR